MGRFWLAFVCPVCGWRHTPKKFINRHQPITYPLELVTGGGRARGFRVARYIPWDSLPIYRGTMVWDGIKSMYSRLAAAYDNFYAVLGFLSPRMRLLLQALKYEESYGNESLLYGSVYSRSLPDITESYRADSPDYPRAYETLLKPIPT